MIYQIAPSYPPDVSGVGDYAEQLARVFEKARVPFQTLVARQEENQRSCHYSLSSIDGEGLFLALQGANRVLLHFSGYGYARRGLCGWLVDGLGRWKVAENSRRIVTMFHEVYATGPVWRSSFWTAPAQRKIARDIALLSDACFVSSQGGQAQLYNLVPSLTVGILPVFSTVGEPETQIPLFERKRLAVVFGGATQRRRVYDILAGVENAVAARLRLYGVTNILDIGPNIVSPLKIGDIDVLHLGALPAEDVSTILQNSRIGFIDYPGHVFTKSSIAAGYFAHSLMVVNTSRIGGRASDLREGSQFSGLEAFLLNMLPAQLIAGAGNAWYLQYGIARTAQKFQAQLE